MTKRRNKRDLTADELDQGAGGYHTIDPPPPDEA